MMSCGRAALVLLVLVVMVGMALQTSAIFHPHMQHDHPTPLPHLTSSRPIGDIDVAFDCAMRQLALEYSEHLLPSRSPLVSVFDALQLTTLCNITSEQQLDYELVRAKLQLSPIIPLILKPNLVQHKATGSDGTLTFFVSPTGDDANPGTLAAPFATLMRAQAAVRGAGSVTKRGTAIVYVREGTYYMTETLQLEEADSHTQYLAFQNENVILSGGVSLSTLSWQPSAINPNIWVAKVDESLFPSSPVSLSSFNSLFVNGSRLIRARYPNANPETAQNPDGYTNAFLAWIPSNISDPGVLIDIDTPNRNGSSAQYGMSVTFQNLVAGPADRFVPAVLAGPSRSHLTTTAPMGVVYNVSAFSPRVSSWSNPSTGVIHAFMDGYWGNWQWQIDNLDLAAHTINFGRGGFQMCQGSGAGGLYYVENILEELDSPGEWYYDVATQLLYVWPNETATGGWNENTLVVASALETLVTVRGSESAPAHDIIIQGFSFTHTPTTFLADYEVPSGGDWAVHRGGGIVLEGTERVTVQQCLFTQLGGNAVAISNYNREVVIADNEFVWLGDSAIVSIGTTHLIDGTEMDVPSGTQVLRNLVHEIGMFGKQVSFYFQALSCNTTVAGNVAFNGPRAGINFNDGFGGANQVHDNLLFNWVRETGDHGNFNSWDRQPFLTSLRSPGSPSLMQAESYITRNFVVNNYHSAWPIDHDDGSSYYYDSYNLLIYGGYKNFLGHSKTIVNNMYLYPDVTSATTVGFKVPFCANSGGALTGQSGWDETWSNNTCVLNSGLPYAFDSCNPGNLNDPPNPTTGNNLFLTPTGTLDSISIPCGSTTYTLSQFQAMGRDGGSTIAVIPPIPVLMQWGRNVLGF